MRNCCRSKLVVHAKHLWGHQLILVNLSKGHRKRYQKLKLQLQVKYLFQTLPNTQGFLNGNNSLRRN